MPESFGARLRQRREERQIALATIADQTKINVTVLEALERDDVSRWPAGIFRRAFIRAYAHAVGLDADEVVREFMEVHPDPVQEVTMPAIAAALESGTAAPPPNRLRNLVGSAFGRVSRRRGADEESVASGPLHVVEQHVVEPHAVQPHAVEPQVVQPQVVSRDITAPQNPSPAPSRPADAPSEPDLLAAANLCVELARVNEPTETAPLLERAARILDAAGIVVWVWHPQGRHLNPELAHGYSDRVLAQLPKIGCDSDNATAAAFRSGNTCVVNGSELASGALVIPLIARSGCVGVLAIELQQRREQKESVRALATIFAAQLATTIVAARPAGVDRRRA